MREASLAGESRAGAQRTCIVCDVSDRAVVLGSTQPRSDVDLARCEALGAAVVRRRSGGGAVFVAPGAQIWVDVYLPPGDPLADQDVARSFLWFGRAWAAAVSFAAPEAAGPVTVVPPGTPPTRWARTLCFGSLGAGEVTVGGRKVVGISQRRDRHGLWLHSMALLTDTSRELVECLSLDDANRVEATAALSDGAATIDAAAGELVAALLGALP